MRQLPVLQKSSLVLASPCEESFLSMPLQGRGRHCEQCQKTVVDMTRMTRREAEALFDRENENLCGYVLSNEEGETFFRSEPRLPSMLATGLAAALLVSGCGAAEPAPVETAHARAHSLPMMMPITAKQIGLASEVHEAEESVPCEREAEAEPMSDQPDAGPAPRPHPRPHPIPRPGGIRRLPRP